jgi:hypothetical protein
VGSHPASGGCLVQVANWLANPSIWTDSPIHVHPLLCNWGIRINDSIVDDNERRRLALAAARISGTNIELTEEREKELDEIARACPWLISSGCGCGCRGETRPPKEMIDWYFKLIDEFDRITGRDSDVAQPEERYRALAEMEPPEAAQPNGWLSNEIVYYYGTTHTTTWLSAKKNTTYIKTELHPSHAAQLAKIEQGVKELDEKLQSLKPSFKIKDCVIEGNTFHDVDFGETLTHSGGSWTKASGIWDEAHEFTWTTPAAHQAALKTHYTDGPHPQSIKISSMA